MSVTLLSINYGARAMFYVYFRNTFYASATDVKRATLQDAVDAGFSAGRAFDVHEESGAVAWLWEQRA